MPLNLALTEITPPGARPALPDRAAMTERERLCLHYLSPLMEANAAMIGRALLARRPEDGGRNCAAVGGAVVGRLRRRGLVTYLPDLHAWRITAAGRAALSEPVRPA